MSKLYLVELSFIKIVIDDDNDCTLYINNEIISIEKQDLIQFITVLTSFQRNFRHHNSYSFEGVTATCYVNKKKYTIDINNINLIIEKREIFNGDKELSLTLKTNQQTIHMNKIELDVLVMYMLRLEKESKICNSLILYGDSADNLKEQLKVTSNYE